MKCLLTIAECGGLDAVTIKPVSLDAKQQKDPDYVRDFHPFGKVPVLMTPTGVRIYETLAIVTCLSSAREGLVPDDPTAAALMHQWISVHSSYFKPAMFPVYLERILKPRRGGGAPDEQRVKAALAATGEVLDVLEAALAQSGSEYLIGDEYTLADVYFTPELDVLVNRVSCASAVLDGRPALSRWFRRLETRQTWAANKAGWTDFAHA